MRVIGIVYNLGKFYYKLDPLKFFDLINEMMSLFTAKKTNGFYRNPRYLFLRFNDKNNVGKIVSFLIIIITTMLIIDNV